jgi:hypothetical protein
LLLSLHHSLWCCSYVSETTRQFALPSLAQRHILAGLASAVGGLSAPYERASRIHERPIVNWLWAAGCHPFGPFSNSSQISQVLQDVALVMLSAIIFHFRETCNEMSMSTWWLSTTAVSCLCFLWFAQCIRKANW